MDMSYCLRPMTRDDLQMVLAWRNQERIRQVMYTDHIISWEEHVAWFADIEENPTRFSRIFELDGRPVGIVHVTDFDQRHGTAYWGFYLGETDVPRGTGSRMEYLALEWAFKDLGVRKLCGEVLDFNTDVLRLHGRFGFTREGLLRRHRLKNGEYRDIVTIALFAEEWESLRLEINQRLFSQSR